MPWGVAAGVIGTAASSAISSALAPSPNIPGSQLSSSSGVQRLGSFNFGSPSSHISDNGLGDLESQIGPGTQSALNLLTGSTNDANSGLTKLLGLVDPTTGALTTSQVEAIHNAALKATSDLRGNLAQRRILGSSFGQNALAQVGLQAGQDEAQVKAQGMLESIDAQMKILGQRLTNNQALATQEINAANFSTTAAINIANGTQQTFADNSSVIGQLALANAQGLGAATANVGSSVTDAINKLLSQPSAPAVNGLTIPSTVDAPGSIAGFGGGL